MKCSTYARDGVTVCRVGGRLTLADSGGALEKQVRTLVEGGARRIVCDLSGIDLMDSSGLGELTAINRLLHDTGGALALSGLADRVHKVLDLSGLTTRFRMFGDVDAAVSSLRR